MSNLHKTKNFVVFYDTKDSLPVLKRGYSHCVVLIYDPQIKGHIWIDRTFTSTRLTAIPNTGEDPGSYVLREMLKRGAKDCRVLAVAGASWKFKVYNPFSLFTCVGVAKRLLGVNNPFVLTPRQLYKHLNTREAKRGMVRNSKKAALRQ